MDTKRAVNDLPCEIKARIVELCAEQDERYKNQLDALVKTEHKAGEALKTRLTQHKSPYGRSLLCVFGVSKEFSKLAAPFIFKVLKVSKIDLRFKCDVARSRLPLFQELHLDGGDQNKLSDLLTFLPDLPAIHTHVVHSAASESLWQEGPRARRRNAPLDPSRAIPPMAQYAARRLPCLRRVRELITNHVDARHILPLIEPSSASLTSLTMTTSSHTYGQVFKLGEALSAAHSLAVLKVTVIDSYGHFNPPFDLSGTTSSLSLTPPLRELDLTLPFLHSSHLSFAARFSSTLKTLRLGSEKYSCLEDPQSFPQPLFTAETFPAVTSFTFAANIELSLQTIASIGPAHFPSLKELELDVCVEDWASPSSPLRTFASFSTLAHLRILDFEELSDEAQNDITAFCTANSLTLDGSLPFPLAPASPASPASVASDESDGKSVVLALAPPDNSISSLHATLKYLASAADQAAAEGDEATLTRLRETLHPMELDRMAKELWDKA
ncbi:hypothetical protein JCM10207_000649 [Rhodosporidiobolus poonsookiae]